MGLSDEKAWKVPLYTADLDNLKWLGCLDQQHYSGRMRQAGAIWGKDNAFNVASAEMYLDHSVHIGNHIVSLSYFRVCGLVREFGWSK